MDFNNPCFEGIILNRYKRFLSDIKLHSGETINAHVPNTGSMKTCWGPGWPCIVSKSSSPSRKMPYTLELTQDGDELIGINTSNTNKIVHEALTTGLIPELSGYVEILPEQKFGDSRFDFLLKGHLSEPDCFVEVKNVTLKIAPHTAAFPDAVSTRGLKHLQDLVKAKHKGFRSVMLYVVQRSGMEKFRAAHEYDPDYATELMRTREHKVEILVYGCKMKKSSVTLDRPLTWDPS